MKLNINQIIENTISNEIKKRILSEQGDKNIENMKKLKLTEATNEFVECFTKAKQNNEETFDYKGSSYSVQEVYDEFEQETPCDECDQPMDEQDDVNDPGQDYFNKVISQYKTETDESELSGVTQGSEGTTSNFITYESEKEKKTIRLTETKFKEMITRMVSEALKPKVVGNDPKVNTLTKPFKTTTKKVKKSQETLTQKDTPGMQAVRNAHKEGEGQEDDYINSVDKKIKDYLNFDGNDNPEFPHQVGEGEVMATRDGEFGDEAQEYVDTYRGMGIQDSTYDTEPSEKFKENMKKSLVGDSTMGNPSGNDVANAIKTDVGEKIFKNIKKKRDNIADDPMYIKDEQPVDEDESYKKKQHDPGYETINEVKDIEPKEIVTEDIKRMKKLLNYNEKTQ